MVNTRREGYEATATFSFAIEVTKLVPRKVVAIFVIVDGHFGLLGSHFKDKGRSVRVSSAVIDFVNEETVLFITILFEGHYSLKIMS